MFWKATQVIKRQRQVDAIYDYVFFPNFLYIFLRKSQKEKK